MTSDDEPRPEPAGAESGDADPGAAEGPEPADGDAWFLDETALLSAARDACTPDDAPMIDDVRDLVHVARGGEGDLYRGVDLADGDAIAIKVMRAESSAERESARQRRFDRALELLARIDHPAIVPVVRAGRLLDGRAYLVMPFVEGVTLDQHWRGATTTRRGDPSHAPDIRAVVAMTARIADAIDAAHRRGVLHRDLKPANVIIDDAGAPHVLDFGLARDLVIDGGPTGALAPTRTGQFLGSVAWAAPERLLHGDGVADVRGDVWALAAILHHALTGRTPRDDASSLQAIVHDAAHLDPTPPSRFRPVAADLDAIVLRGLARDPDDRYESAGALARDLRHWLDDEPIEARRGLAIQQARRAIVRLRRVVALTLVALLCAAVLVGFVLDRNRRTNDALALAEARRIDAAREAATSRASLGFLRGVIASINPQQDSFIGLGDRASENRTSREGGPRWRDVLDQAVVRFRADRGMPQAARAGLATTIAQSYLTFGDTESAAPLIEEAIAWYERNAPSDDPRDRGGSDGVPAEPTTGSSDALAHGRALASLGHLLALRGDHDGSRAAFERSATIQRAAAGSSGALASEVDAATVLASAGQFEEATARLAELVDEARRRGFLRSELVASVNLAKLLRIRDERAEAHGLLSSALVRSDAGFGPGSMISTSLVAELAATELDLKRTDAALAHIARARAGYERLLGEEHFHVAETWELEARAHTNLGEFERAIEIERVAIAMFERTLAGDRAPLGRAFERLGLIQELNGEIDAAQESYRRSFELLAEHAGPQHPDTLVVRGRLRSDPE